MWAPNELEDIYNNLIPHRNRNRTCLKWDSVVNSFCHSIHNDSWQNLSINVLNKCTDHFVKHFNSEWAESLPKRIMNSFSNSVVVVVSFSNFPLICNGHVCMIPSLINYFPSLVCPHKSRNIFEVPSFNNVAADL